MCALLEDGKVKMLLAVCAAWALVIWSMLAIDALYGALWFVPGPGVLLVMVLSGVGISQRGQPEASRRGRLLNVVFITSLCVAFPYGLLGSFLFLCALIGGK